mgnify:CR=1 FL=1
MLNNGLFFSLIISSLSTGIIYLLTNRKNHTNGSNYESKDLFKIFFTILIVCFSVTYYKNKTMNNISNHQVPMGSSESLLTHSSRPPF